MKTRKFAWLLISLLLTGATYAQQSETRKVSAFTRLEIGGPFDAVIRQGDETSVKITTENIDSKKVHTEVSENTLKVSLENGLYNNIRIKVEITYQNLDAIHRSGSGNLSCESDLSSGNEFHLSSSGSGSITIKGKIKATGDAFINRSGSGNIKLMSLQAEGINMDFSGSGDFFIDEGSAKTQKIHLSGSGKINAYGLKTDTCSAVISGSGNIQVYVSSLIEATISGSGKIDYRGDAAVKNIKVHGSGGISRKG
jgi:hypothetical protein